MSQFLGKDDKKFKIYVSQEPKIEKKGFHRLDELEKYQKKVKKRHNRMKVRLVGLGKQKTGSAYPKKPNYKRGKSAPVGFGGS